jgi:hypothetical protein
MKSKYRFRHPTGRVIQVTYAHIPGKWFSTGTHDKYEAIQWAEKRIHDDFQSQHSNRNVMTLRQFSLDFFTAKDPQGYRLRNEKRNRNYTEHYYYAHQSRLDGYILPKFGEYLLPAINDVMIEDWLMTIKGRHTNGKELADDSKNKVLICVTIQPKSKES